MPSYSLDLAGLLGQAVDIGLALVQALLILVLGWMISKIVKRIVVVTLRRTNLDRRLASLLTDGRKESLEVAETTGSFAYGFLMLFVSIEVLRALGLTMITEPLTGLLATLIGFLPRLLAAGILGLVAWCVANLARMFGLRFLRTIDLDRRLSSGSKGTAEDSKAPSVTKTLGDAIYYFVFLFFLPQILDALRMEGLGPVGDMVGQILAVIPRLIGAAFVFAIFYFVARVVQRLTQHLLGGLGFDELPRILGLEGHGGPKASVAAGWAVLVGLLFIGVGQAANTLGLILVADLAQGLLEGLFRILVACSIFALGLWASGRVSATIADWEESEGRQTRALSMVAKWGILLFTGAMAIGQTGLAPEILHMTIGAVALGSAIAGGLAFGLGGRERAARWLETRELGGS